MISMKTKIITYASVIILALCCAAAWLNRTAKRPDKVKPGAMASTEVGAVRERESVPSVARNRGGKSQRQGQAASLPARKQMDLDEDTTPATTENMATVDQPVFGKPWVGNEQDSDLFMAGREQLAEEQQDLLDANKRDEFGVPALQTAVANGDGAAVKALLEKGADVNLPDAEGNTSLMIAVERNDIELVKTLLEAGGDVTVKNLYGDTALLVAVWAEQVEVAEALLQVGADPRVKNHDDQTPLTLAVAKENSQLVQILGQYSGM